MKKILALAIIASMSLVALPASHAGEVVTEDYDIPSGPVNTVNPATGNRFGPALATRPCAPEWRDWGDEEPEDQALTTAFTTSCEILDPLNGGPDDGFVRMGIFAIASKDCGDCYTDFLISVTDTLPADTYYLFCIFTDYQDGRDGGRDNTCGEVSDCTTGVDPSTCDDIEDPRTAGCTSASITSPVPSGGSVNEPGAFVYGVYVDETTGTTCLGSKGSMTVDMS